MFSYESPVLWEWAKQKNKILNIIVGHGEYILFFEIYSRVEKIKFERFEQYPRVYTLDTQASTYAHARVSFPHA